MLPIYTFALYAGPYKYHEEDISEIDESKDNLKIPPMKLYLRNSLFDKIDHKEMFQITRNGLNYYSKYFCMEYPFSKCDQIFSPTHAYDGLSSQGIISYKEEFLFADIKNENKKTQYKLAYFHIVVLHELAHQWFGNIVSPKWWDDLWILESLAVLMSLKAFENDQEIHLKKDEKWVKFADYKDWGLGLDIDEKSSHPLRPHIENI